jgi:flagellar basal-body rod modification protein FlgD
MASSTAFDSTLGNLGIGRASAGNPLYSATSKQATGTMDQGDFLKLMTAQLKNQDPFAPVDNTQMVAQMAQFSSLAGISEMNTTLKAMSDKLNAGTAADAMSYVGKTVLAPGVTAYGRTSGGLSGAVELDGEATNVSVTISDANGLTLKTMELGANAAGTIEYDWDGKTNAGEDAGTGPFNVSVLARKGSASVAARNLAWVPVAAVSIPASGPAQLTLPGLGQVPVTAVRKIG